MQPYVPQNRLIRHINLPLAAVFILRSRPEAQNSGAGSTDFTARKIDTLSATTPICRSRKPEDAADFARQLVKQGIHPAQQKQLDRIKAEFEHSTTFEAIAKEWVALRDWEEVTKKRRLNMLERVVFPYIGKLPAKQVPPISLIF